MATRKELMAAVGQCYREESREEKVIKRLAIGVRFRRNL